MAKQKENDNIVDGEVVNEDSQALVETTNEQRGVSAFAGSGATPLTREGLEIIEELQSLERSVEEGFGKTTKPSDLAEAGTVFDVVDAWFTDMTEDGEVKQKVCYSIVEQDTGLAHTVMQSLDKAGIRGKYATLFSRCKALGIPREPLKGYRFVFTEKTFAAGNRAAVLEKIKTAGNRAAVLEKIKVGFKAVN